MEIDTDIVMMEQIFLPGAHSYSAVATTFSGSRSSPTIKTLPKAQRTRRLSSAYQSYFISQVLTQILIKYLQNFDQAPTSKSQPNISISTELKHKNLDQTKLQNLDQE